MSFFNSIFNILRFNKKNWKAVVLCVFAATIFWCFNALNKRYTTTLSFPLTFDFDNEKFIPVRPLPHTVRINVTGIGWNLLRRGAGVKVPPLILPLERPLEVRKIVGSTLPGFFANQLGGFEINFIITDTLHLAIEPKTSRKVKLALDAPDILFKTGYALTSAIEVYPDSITVEGPSKLITGLTDPVYLKLPQRNINDNFNEMVEIRFLDDELIHRLPATVNVRFQVDKMIAVQDSVRLKVINAPKQSWQLIERKELSCTVAIPRGFLDSYHKDSVTAVLDLQHFTRGQKKMLPTLTGLPPYSKVIRVDSVVIKL